MHASRGTSKALLLSAVVVLALNLRLSVNALGTLLPEIRVDLHVSAGAAGLLLALPPLVFAFAGIVTPMVAARVGNHRLVVMALLISGAGQILRALGPGVISLFLGTLIALVGLAIGNVLMPGLIRQHFPQQITTITSVYVTMLSLGATVSSGLSIPVEHALHGTWRAPLLVWAAIAVIALLPWLAVAFGSRRTARSRRHSSVPLRALIRSPLAWAMAIMFGVQSAHIYVVIGWLGQVLLDAGVGEVKMGALLSMAPAIGIAMSLAVPVLLRRQRLALPLILLLSACYLVGYLGLMLAPVSGAWVWMFFMGVGGGTFPVVLTLVALRAFTADGVIALSAFTQCVGYLIGALAPVAFGLVHDVGHSWTPSLILMMVLLLPMAAVGSRLARPRYLEDEIPTV
ncbi:MFS transporter, CP family, cyanate transporter [Nakamurella panacisegetis]|uniref:MFS transporter, CP family, cyanate transporter n=1 Tax=Nakamurella panacisegetis TaxID=1090615 RepID=A0A1H0KD55_9ACTN|nr:MFS transporter [Nakamurella panacisegetis]SDO53864.1 MFS transporter, CP family, cyanate transporter [Nakamurella panacisegetis]